MAQTAGQDRERPPQDMDFIQSVLHRWNLSGAPQSVDDLGGAFNHNWRVVTRSADVVIRVRPPWLTARRVQQVHALQQRLNGKAIPTPSLRHSRRRNTYEMVDSRLVEVYDYLIEEGNRHWSAVRWAAAFAHLGDLHRAFEQLGLSISPPLVSNFATTRTLHRMLSDTRERLSTLPADPNLKEARAICDEAQHLMDRIEANLLRMEGQHLPRHLVHGDFHLGNLLFDTEDRVCYTLDFDFVAHRNRIYDIAYALRLALPQLTDNPDCALDSALVREWLSLYESRALHPLTQGERAFLGHQLAQVALFFIAEACRVRDPVAQVMRESPYLELAIFLVRYPDSLLEGC